MDRTIVLKADDGDLELEGVNALGWTRCHLHDDSRLLLGADVLPHVIRGLLKAL